MRTVILIMTAGLLLGCGKESSSAHADGNDHAPKAADFKKGLGLRVDPEAALFIGLRTAAVDVKGGTPSVPASALLETAEGHFVYVSNGDRLLRTPVKPGDFAGGEVRVADGLFEGDVVAVAGVRYLWFAELQALKGGVGCADGH